MSDADTIFDELKRIRVRLEGDLTYDERTALERRREELHDAARVAERALPTDPAVLRQRIASLEAAREHLLTQHVGIASIGGGGGGAGGGGVDPYEAMELNRAIDEQSGRAELETRIEALKRRLEELEPSAG